MKPCAKCQRRNKRHGTTTAKHGVAYEVRDGSGWTRLHIDGSFFPEMGACRAYAEARSEFDSPQSVVLIWCDGSERIDRTYEKGKLVAA